MIIVLLYVSCRRNKKIFGKKAKFLKVVMNFTVAEDFVDRRVAKKLVGEEFEKSQTNVGSGKWVFAGFEERKCRCKHRVTLEIGSHDLWPGERVAKH